MSHRMADSKNEKDSTMNIDTFERYKKEEQYEDCCLIHAQRRIFLCYKCSALIISHNGNSTLLRHTRRDICSENSDGYKNRMLLAKAAYAKDLKTQTFNENLSSIRQHKNLMTLNQESLATLMKEAEFVLITKGKVRVICQEYSHEACSTGISVLQSIVKDHDKKNTLQDSTFFHCGTSGQNEETIPNITAGFTESGSLVGDVLCSTLAPKASNSVLSMNSDNTSSFQDSTILKGDEELSTFMDSTLKIPTGEKQELSTFMDSTYKSPTGEKQELSTFMDSTYKSPTDFDTTIVLGDTLVDGSFLDEDTTIFLGDTVVGGESSAFEVDSTLIGKKSKKK